MKTKLTAKEDKPEPPAPVTCPECSVGHLKQRSVAYFTWMGDELISVPDFPAWVCDVCGRREYDTNALNWLAAMLSPLTGKPFRPSGSPVRAKNNQKNFGIRSLNSD